jgi:hypothetical protein
MVVTDGAENFKLYRFFVLELPPLGFPKNANFGFLSVTKVPLAQII